MCYQSKIYMFIFLIVSDLLMLRYNKQRATLRLPFVGYISVM